jgi:hypothetical protein
MQGRLNHFRQKKANLIVLTFANAHFYEEENAFEKIYQYVHYVRTAAHWKRRKMKND